MRKPKEKDKLLERDRSDYKNMEAFLKRHNLVDERGLWVAGYHDTEAQGHHPVARNLFFGNSKLRVLSVHDNEVWFLKNTHKGFELYNFGRTEDVYTSIHKRHIIWPMIFVSTASGDATVRVTMNKRKAKELHELLK